VTAVKGGGDADGNDMAHWPDSRAVPPSPRRPLRIESQTPMPFRSIILALLILPVWLGSPCVASAAESNDSCTGFITSLPAVIGTAGTWCLKQDLTTANTSGQAIIINSNNVTIDCNNFSVTALYEETGLAIYGIVADSRRNVTVRRCGIRGFFIGLYFTAFESGSGGHLVEDSSFDGNHDAGLYVYGQGSVIRRNRVTNTGELHGWGGFAAIQVGDSVDVLDNVVSGVVATSGSNQSVYGIAAVYFDSTRNGASISRNRVSGLLPDEYNGALAIAASSANHVTIRDNVVVNNPATGSGVGIYCVSGARGTKDNVINGFGAQAAECYGNGNDITP
jgi:hypothetical protein